MRSEILSFLLFVKYISGLFHIISIKNSDTFDYITGSYTITGKIYDEIEILNCERMIKILNIIDTSVDSIDSKVFEKLPNLEVINFESNELVDFPQSILSIEKLRELRLKNNKLRNLPENINSLSNLKILDLSHNCLDSIPDTVCLMNGLFELYLSENQIKILPENIGDLSNLRVLDLYSNRLSELPNSIISLRSLKTLYIQIYQIILK